MFLGIILSVFILYPFSILLLRSLGISAESFKPGIDIFTRIFSKRGTWKALVNTIYTALLVTVLTAIVSGILAWLVVRTDFHFKRLIKNLSFLTFIIPPYILALSWLEFLGRNGYLHRILGYIFGLKEYTLEYYSITAVAIVMSIHLYPLVFMALCNALEKHDPSLENAAIMSGATAWKTTFSITIPLIIPSFLSIGLLVFSRTMANFGVPALLALPVRKEVLTTRIYASLSDLNIDEATALSLLLVFLSGLVFTSYTLIFRKKSFATVNYIGKKPKLYSLGKRKGIITAVVFLFQGITTILPLVTIFLSSFLKRWGLPLKLEYLTLNNYIQLFFKNDQAATAFRNSIFYGITGATFAALIGSGIAFISHSSVVKGRKVLELIASWPMAFPNIVLAVAAILAWNTPPLALYGTPWIIIVTYMVLFTPIIMKNVTGLIQNHDRTQTLAARISGASPFRSFLDVTFPAISPGIKSGWLLCFLIALKEIPISLMLYSSGQETLGVLLFGMQSQSYGLEMTSTLAVVIIGLIFIGNIMIQTGKRRIKNENASD